MVSRVLIPGAEWKHNLDAFNHSSTADLARRMACIASPRLPAHDTWGNHRSQMVRTLSGHRRWPVQCSLTDPVRVASTTDAYASGSHDDVAHVR